MSNIIYDNNLFNEEIKNKYVRERKNTPSTLRVFKAAAALEAFYGKDLYDFNREELKRLFFVLNPSKFNASYQNGLIVSNYIVWAIDQELRKTINPLLSIERKWFEQFVNAGKTYFTEEELFYFIDKCRNPQDAVIISLRMEGVGGEANSELLNLKIDDVNETRNILRLTNSKGDRRELRVSDRCIDLCIAAHHQTTYLKKNGAYKKQTKATMTNLVENEYIIKSSITKNNSHQRAEPHIVHRRLSVLSKFFNESYLTPLNITYSGMLIMARDIYFKKGKLDFEDYGLIFDTFGMSNINETGEQQYYRLKREFLNEEKLKELYNL